MASSTFVFVVFLLSLFSATSINGDSSHTFLHCFQNYTRSSNKSSILLTPANSSFDNVFRSSIQNGRFLFSGAGTIKPSFIVVPNAVSDVQAAVSCGLSSGLRLRVRGGGHDYEGLSYISSGVAFVLIDLSNIRSVTVDSAGGTAWVGAGATLGEVYYSIAVSTSAYGFPAGLCPTVGVGGHISGGGIGTLLRKYGTSADNLIDAQLVDVIGRLLTAATMGADLFWAIRGGGAASFGVVVYYKIKLVPLPPTVTVYTTVRTLKTNATQLVNKWQLFAHAADDGLFMRAVVQGINDQSFPGGRTIQVTFQGLFLGRRSDLLSNLSKGFPELGLQAKEIKEVSWIGSVLYFAGYSNMNSLLDRRPHSSGSFKGKSDFVRKPVTIPAWNSIWKKMLGASDTEALVMIMDPFGGIMDRINGNNIAFPHRKGNLYSIQYYLYWSDSASANKHLSWMRSFYQQMAPYVSQNPRAAYLNYKDLDLGSNQGGLMNTSYKEASVWGVKYFLNNYPTLAKVKARVDPVNYFWDEQSIPPFST